MRPRLGYVLVLGALVFGLAGSAAAETDSHARIVRLSYVDGQVQMDRDGSSGLEAGFLNMPLAQGTQVVTGGDGYAEIEFENGGTIRLTPSSNLRMRELGSRGDSRVTLLDFDSGTAYFNIKGDSDDDFRVLLQGQEVRVHKSARFRIRLERDSAQIAVTKGELQFTGENEVRVKKDETLTLDFQDRGRYFLAKSIETLTYDAWDRERDDYRDRYASERYSNSRYAYGYSDLNYYGSFINVSGYGDCWRPYGYGASWDPFLDGAWVWYPRWGYVWVSSYPWGWTPYRYGRWIWVSGYNWCWQPGSYWDRWSYYPVVHRWPSWYDRRRCHPPERRHGGGSRVVVVGRGPYTGKGTDGRNGRRVAVDGAPDLPAPRIQSGGGRNAGSPTRGPSPITPGVLPDQNVAAELRRVHGNEENFGRRHMVEVRGDEGASANVGAATGGSPNAGSSPVGVTGPTAPASPQKIVVAPAPPQQRGDVDRLDTGRGRAESQPPRTTPAATPAPQPAAPSVRPAPAPPVRPAAPASDPAPRSQGSGYRGASGYSGANSGGSSAPHSSGAASASSSGSGGYRSQSSGGGSSSSSGGSRSSSSSGSRSSGSSSSSTAKSPK